MHSALIGRALLSAFGVGVVWYLLGGVLGSLPGRMIDGSDALPQVAAALIGTIGEAGAVAERAGRGLLALGVAGWVAACTAWLVAVARGGTRRPGTTVSFDAWHRPPAF